MLCAMGSLGAPELVTLLLLFASFGLPLWGLVDAARRDEARFRAAGQNKTLWIVLNALGLVVWGVGAIVALVYLLVVRPKVAAVAA
jgi:hypothetical protein